MFNRNVENDSPKISDQEVSGKLKNGILLFSLLCSDMQEQIHTHLPI
jgi:hypothetical protein